IIEIAARNELLKQTGHSSAERFAAELDRQLAKGKR
ncbi:MAG: HPr kinase/phosphorylase, partial [Deltaproteobacteria bacterium]|nr:HPr kinase/phosphorylase [Deltaproteobacteria bacterium]